MRKILILVLCVTLTVFVSCSNSETINESIKSAISTLDSATNDTDIAITLKGKTDNTTLLLLKEALLRLEARKTGKGFVTIDMADLYGFDTLDTAYFGNMQILKSVILPDVLEEVPKYMFSRCSKLKEVTIPVKTAYTGFGAFSECPELETVNIESPLMELGAYAFSNANEKLKLNCPAGKIYYLESQSLDIKHLDTIYSHLPLDEALKIKKTLSETDGSQKNFNLSVKYYSDSDCIYASVDDENGSCFKKLVTFGKNSDVSIITGTDIDGIFASAVRKIVITCPTDGSRWYKTTVPSRFYSREGGGEIEFDGKDVEISEADAGSFNFYKVPGGKI